MVILLLLCNCLVFEHNESGNDHPQLIREIVQFLNIKGKYNDD
jgi:hypothetical protein